MPRSLAVLPFVVSGAVAGGLVGAVAFDLEFLSRPKWYDCRARRALPVTIFGSESVGVLEIDIASLRLEDGTGLAAGPPTAAVFADRGRPADTGRGGCCARPDGLLDLDVGFAGEEVAALIGCSVLSSGSDSAPVFLAGRLTDDFEVLVVNDGSTDATGSIARRYERARVIDAPNAGLSAARNIGVAHASGTIVAFTDADARVDQDWLTYLIQPFLTSAVAGAGGPNVVPPDDPPMAQYIARAPGGPTHVLLDDRGGIRLGNGVGGDRGVRDRRFGSAGCRPDLGRHAGGARGGARPARRCLH